MSYVKEQYDRMIRWYGYLIEIHKGRQHDKSTEYYQDIVYVFFMNCYHLKDWIINDPNVNLPSKQVEDFINSEDCMKISADICNSLKHLELNRSPRSGKVPKIESRAYTVQIPNQTIQINYFIETNTGSKEVFELATECIHKWTEFIKNNIKGVF